MEKKSSRKAFSAEMVMVMGNIYRITLNSVVAANEIILWRNKAIWW